MIIGFAGYSGAGKSTAVEYLVRHGIGEKYYAAAILFEELARLGLPSTPDNERSIRQALRSKGGAAVFAERAIPRLSEMSGSGIVLIDAVFCPEERDCYAATFGLAMKVIAVSATFQARVERLRIRADRQITAEKLAERDKLERERLRLTEVVDTADFSLSNNGTLEQFEGLLKGLIPMLGS